MYIFRSTGICLSTTQAQTSTLQFGARVLRLWSCAANRICMPCHASARVRLDETDREWCPKCVFHSQCCFRAVSLSGAVGLHQLGGVRRERPYALLPFYDVPSFRPTFCLRPSATAAKLGFRCLQEWALFAASGGRLHCWELLCYAPPPLRSDSGESCKPDH